MPQASLFARRTLKLFSDCYFEITYNHCFVLLNLKLSLLQSPLVCTWKPFFLTSLSPEPFLGFGNSTLFILHFYESNLKSTSHKRTHGMLMFSHFISFIYLNAMWFCLCLQCHFIYILINTCCLRIKKAKQPHRSVLETGQR